MQHDLVLDPNIRDWVFLPLIVILFLVGILRHNATSLLKSEPKAGDTDQLKQSMHLNRSRRLRANARFVPAAAFHARRAYFAHPTTGVFSEKLEAPQNALAMMSDPDMMQNMLKGCAPGKRSAHRDARDEPRTLIARHPPPHTVRALSPPSWPRAATWR
jgi:hypothetical protein